MSVAATRGERAYGRLRAAILGGALGPGERLLPADLAARFDLGLTPIREALARLSAEGLVAAETHRGSRVLGVSAQAYADLMRSRRQIERLCLVQAMSLGDGPWEAEIVAALHLLAKARLPASAEDLATARLWEAAHRRFHLALVAACGSDWLLRFWNALADHAERYRTMRVLHHREAEAEVRDVEAEHRALAEAVLARDAAAAPDLMDRHLAATEGAVARFLAAEAGRSEDPQRPEGA